MKNPKTIFLIILSLTAAALIIDMPKNYQFEGDFFGRKVSLSINRPNIDFNLGPIRIHNDFSLKKGLDLAGGAHLVFRAGTDTLPEENRADALSSLRDNIERRVNIFGLSEAVVQTSKTSSEDRLIVEIPGQVDPVQAVALIGQTAQLNFKLEADIPPEATGSATIYDLFSKETDLNGANLRKAEVVFDPNTGKPQVSLEFDNKGKDIFAELTKNNVDRMMAIFLDNFLVSAPSINEPILDGKAVISGNFSLEDAKQMVSQLNAGALPVSVELIEQRTVSATLGEESISRGTRAGLVGVGLVALFMVGFYGRLGILANLGLFIYAVLSLAMYKLIPVTLTMPGVAGFLLSLGMAVDSNILIFERMKEELRLGRPWRMAMELGFGRAWDSIRDANVCTLITTFVLFNPFDWTFLNTSGMIRGFALTLGLGVMLEMFTGIVVVRTIMRVFYGKGGKR